MISYFNFRIILSNPFKLSGFNIWQNPFISLDSPKKKSHVVMIVRGFFLAIRGSGECRCQKYFYLSVQYLEFQILPELPNGCG